MLFDRLQHVLAVPVLTGQWPGPGRGELVDELQDAPPVLEPRAHRPTHIEATDRNPEANHPPPPRPAGLVAALSAASGMGPESRHDLG
ncbi:MAG: hypothetical protein ACRDOI_29840, partial [Trebonia sp.]